VLAADVGVEPALVERRVERLVARGLLERVTPEPVYRVTAAGETVSTTPVRPLRSLRAAAAWTGASAADLSEESRGTDGRRSDSPGPGPPASGSVVDTVFPTTPLRVGVFENVAPAVSAVDRRVDPVPVREAMGD
jgi:DNA-binding Lrp family transcriptional regulator